MNKTSGIYIILNIKNRKVYLGQAQNIHKRWITHRSLLNNEVHRNKHLQAAWNKYGEKSFQFKILEYCQIENLDEREQHFIDIYMAKGLLYNIAIDARVPGRGRIKSESERQKQSLAQTGRKASFETREKMRIASLNMSEETRKKISVAHTGKHHSEETRRKISESQKGMKKNPPANPRPPISDETRQKMRDARLGKKFPRTKLNTENES